MALIPDDVVIGSEGDPLGDIVDGLDGRQSLFPYDVLVLHGLVPGRTDGGDDRPGRVAQGHQRISEVFGDLFEPARERQLHDTFKGLGCGLEGVCRLLVDKLRRPPHRPVDLARSELARGHAGDPGDQFMSLVHDQHLVLRQDRCALDRVDGEQGVVGHDDISELGPLTGGLGEALGPVGAFARPQTLPGGDGDLAPGAVGDARSEIVTVARLRLVRPVPHTQQVLAELAAGGGCLELVEQSVLLLLRYALMEAVQTEVVGPPLQHGELRAPPQQWLQGLDGTREVSLDELPLECERRGGHHDALPMSQRRDEIPQRLSGTGAGLDQQVGVFVNGFGNSLGHGDLAGPLRTAHSGDGGVQELGEGGLRHSGTTLRGSTDNRGHTSCRGLATVPCTAACGRFGRSR